MDKLSIKIDDVLLEKMNSRMEKKGCKTLSQCARELIELGLKIEEAADLQRDKNGGEEIHPLLLDILKTNMTWTLETMFLVRFLVDKEKGEDSDYMKKAKEQALTSVVDLMQKKQKISAGSH
jgi:hypothetical protein